MHLTVYLCAGGTTPKTTSSRHSTISRMSKLVEMASMLETIDRSERIEVIAALAERFKGVPSHIAERPYPDSHRVKECESQVYTWAEKRPDQTLKFYFAVENPQGVAAVATAVILDETLSGARLKEVLRVQPDLVFRCFGGELSLRKRVGIAAIVTRVKEYAKEQHDQTSRP